MKPSAHRLSNQQNPNKINHCQLRNVTFMYLDLTFVTLLPTYASIAKYVFFLIQTQTTNKYSSIYFLQGGSGFVRWSTRQTHFKNIFKSLKFIFCLSYPWFVSLNIIAMFKSTILKKYPIAIPRNSLVLPSIIKTVN